MADKRTDSASMPNISSSQGFQAGNGNLQFNQFNVLPSRDRRVPQELPLDARGFAGRHMQLAELDRLQALSEGRTATVVISAIDGMAGVGKTALAVHAAHRLANRYPDGQLFVDLHGFTPGVPPIEPTDGLERMLHSLGVSGEYVPATVEERSALLRTQLAGKRVLVVLDNAASAAQVRPLLPGTPGCLVVVTSRTKLVGLEDSIPLSLDVLPVNHAVTVFTDAVGEHRVTDADAGVVEEIVELCGRLPLAVRIAAARLRHRPAWTPRQLAELLRNEQSRLNQLRADHLSVATSLGMSYDQLGEDQQRVFRLLSLLPGADADPYTVAALTASDALSAREVLEELLDVHLLVQHVPGRYLFHDLVRAYASERAHADETELSRRAALDRLLGYYAHTVSVAMDVAYPHDGNQRPRPRATDNPVPRFYDPAAAETWMDTEMDNILAVVRSTSLDSLDFTIHMSATLHRHLRMRGRFSDAENLHRRAYEFAQQSGNHQGKLNALIGLGDANSMTNRTETGIGFLEQALRIARDTDNRSGELNALNGMGRPVMLQSNFELSARLFGQALEIAQEVGDRYGEAYALNGIGHNKAMLGDYSDALSNFDRALNISQEIRDLYNQIYSLHGIGVVYQQQGTLEHSVRNFERALQISRDAGEHYGELYALNGLGTTHLRHGNYDAAIQYFRQALELAEYYNGLYSKNRALNGLGNAYLRQGYHQQAIDCFVKLLKLAKDSVNSYGVVDALTGLGNTRLEQARHKQAAHHFEQALDLTRTFNSRDHQFQVHHGLGRVHAVAGRHGKALTHYRTALTLATELGHPQDQARAHDGLARVHHALAQPDFARHHWQAALDVLTAQGCDQTEDPRVTTTSLRDHLADPGRADPSTDDDMSL